LRRIRPFVGQLGKLRGVVNAAARWPTSAQAD
jgi:hypothetical protein